MLGLEALFADVFGNRLLFTGLVVLNYVLAAVFAGLLGTGLTLWTRRTLQRRARATRKDGARAKTAA